MGIVALKNMSDCLIINNYKNPNEHARMWVNKKRVMAYRYLWEREYGKLSKNLVLDHLCRNPHCVNLDHLEPVTTQENLRRGKKAKLNHKIAAEIRQTYRRGKVTQVYLAKKYGVGQDIISRVISKEAWA